MIPCPSDIPPVHLIMQQQLNANVQDSVPYVVNISSSQYLSQQISLEAINADTTLMNGDTVLRNFHTNAMNANMGHLYMVKKYIGTNNLSMATLINSSISPNNTIEQNHKTLNDIYLNTLAVGIDTATQTQLNALYYVAQQCPLIDGRAVFEARSLLNYFLNTTLSFGDSACIGFQDNHRSTKFSIDSGNNSIGKHNVMVYPNPANTELYIELSLQKGQTANICVYNTLGQLILCNGLQNSLNILQIDKLSSGLYYYRIIDNNGDLLKADKQLIIH